MRIGILGGTFDPPHYGHLAVAEAAIAALELEEVMFLPAYKNPLKSGIPPVPAKHRLEMVKLLTQDDERYSVSDMDLTRGGRSYAVDTLMELQMVRPAEYWFLMGADALHDLGEWKQPARLLKFCRIGAVSRELADAKVVAQRLPDEFRPFIDVGPMEPVHISATDLREKITKRQQTNLWMPETVRHYIDTHKLYRS